ncbi:hypothetical protein [Ruegeria sp. HKCCA4812]|uniref:hypothetical protein n=1 Tax=Ruegeria sp. HKCCA4812 TaxID=2682993 RepID=UPI001487BEC7|nr:hypothetical protein [Ruegeria sp. HKCCA4812]
MNAMEKLAAQECAAAKRLWEFGGSDRYPASLPVRPRPKPAPKLEPVVSITEEIPAGMPAFDEALEHVNWCRMQGMSPQDVCRSINSSHLADSWGGAVAILERYIVKMRKNENRKQG